MSLDPCDLDNAARLILDRPIELKSDLRIYTPSAENLARLRDVHNAAVQLANSAVRPDVAPKFWQRLEQDLIVSMVVCLSPNGEKPEVRGRHRHKDIFDSFKDWLEQNFDRPVHVLEICEALNVPARTLHLCCYEYLGMGPKRYMMLRRIRAARELLQGADASTTVTSVATALGFWDLSRFSAFYSRVYGELPGEALRRVRQEQD